MNTFQLFQPFKPFNPHLYPPPRVRGRRDWEVQTSWTYGATAVERNEVIELSGAMERLEPVAANA